MAQNTQEDQTMTNHLFLIGIDKYTHHPKLNSCIRDLKSFKKVLLERYDFEETNVTELYDFEATNKKIQDQFLEYVNHLTENDNLIIYYSGHGFLEKNTERGFWIPVDTQSKDYTAWLPNETIQALIARIKAKHIFLISDCCYSWSMFINQSGKLIDDYYSSPSRWVFASGKEITYDGAAGENSLFAESIVECLTDSRQDLWVGKLIEYVKQRFENNAFQAPQGGPVYDRNHKGGEYIFKVRDDNSESSGEVIPYEDFQTMLKCYTRKSKLIALARYEEDGIGYEIIVEDDPVKMKATYFLMLFEGTPNRKTHEHIRKNHPEIFSGKNLIILLPKEKKQILHEARKRNVSKLYSPLNIFFIDEFIREQCTPEELLDKSDAKYLGTNYFIPPTYEVDTKEHDSLDCISNWLQSKNQPILVLKGAGGIGKTTFAQYISDIFIRDNPKSHIIFIESREIVNELLVLSRLYDNIELYNFYEALHKVANTRVEILSTELLRLNIDAGNILFVLDGLDEVLFNLPRFDVDVFISSVVRHSSGLGSGKVIITSRAIFWDQEKYDSNTITVAEIKPFNETQAATFFSKCYTGDQKSFDKCMALAKDFRFPYEEGEHFFHPYVLDLIRNLTEQKNDLQKLETNFKSTILQPKIRHDFIIHNICYRESKKTGGITIEDQLKIFSFCAINRNGTLRKSDLEHELSLALNKQPDSTTLIAINEHPLLLNMVSTISFRYDFLANHFKSIYVSEHMKLENEYDSISIELINILAESCWFGSAMITDIKNRFQSWGENEILKCSELVQLIYQYENIPGIVKRKAVSGLFNICIVNHVRFIIDSTEGLTNLMRTLFEKSPKEIVGMSLININSNTDKIKFDFRSLIFKDCYFDNYDLFWNCPHNRDTYFIDCYFYNIEHRTPANLTITEDNFINPIADDKFDLVFKHEMLQNQSSNERFKIFLADFFGLFFTKGRLAMQALDALGRYPSIKKRFTGINQNLYDFDDIIKFLEVTGFVRTYFSSKYNEMKIEVLGDLKQEVIKFVKDGTVSPKIAELIIRFTERQKDSPHK